jgi:hypothetical protein
MLNPCLDAKPCSQKECEGCFFLKNKNLNFSYCVYGKLILAKLSSSEFSSITKMGTGQKIQRE